MLLLTLFPRFIYGYLFFVFYLFLQLPKFRLHNAFTDLYLYAKYVSIIYMNKHIIIITIIYIHVYLYVHMNESNKKAERKHAKMHMSV